MTITDLTTETALFGHTNEETAYYVDDYPYGYRLRTTIRYWLETSPKHGDRFVSQTLNPKTGRWNKPKKSTYLLAAAMYLDDQGHVTWTGVGQWAEDANLEHFLTVCRPHLNDAQIAQIASIKGWKAAMEGVTFTVREGVRTEEEQADQDRIARIIARKAAAETTRAVFEEMTR